MKYATIYIIYSMDSNKMSRIILLLDIVLKNLDFVLKTLTKVY